MVENEQTMGTNGEATVAVAAHSFDQKEEKDASPSSTTAAPLVDNSPQEPSPEKANAPSAETIPSQKNPSHPLPVHPTKPKPANAPQGLSELARQLRLLQAENKTQSTQIDRLERQLRIMSDLHGVSVAELRSALTQSCEAEAFGEWQAKVKALEAQLEAAELKLSKQQSSTFENQMDQQKISNLELRIGEFEELEQNLRAEIDKLYKSLTEESAKATRLQSLCDLHQGSIDEYKKKLRLEKKRRKEQEQKALAAEEKTGEELPQLEPSESSVMESNTPIVPVPIPTGPSEQELIYKKQVEILESQLAEREKDSKLRREQFEARFKVQDERLHDLEQQLSSLYVAFDMLQKERNEEQASHHRMAENLFSADAQVAQQVERLERKMPSYQASSTSSSPPVSPSPTQRGYASSPVKPKGVSPSPYRKSPSGRPMVSPGSVSSHAEHTLNSSSERVISGYLWKRGNFNRFKKRYAVLLRGFADYQLCLSDSPEGKFKAYQIGMFQSRLDVVKENRPFAFRLVIDPQEMNALVLAAESGGAMKEWVAALQRAIEGRGRNPDDQEDRLPQIPMSDQEAAELDMALRASLNGNGESTKPAAPAFPEDGTDSDLNAALEASLHDTGR